MAAVFNPKILDASIRDVASYLSDNQKVDLLLYAMRSFPFEGCVPISLLVCASVMGAAVQAAAPHVFASRSESSSPFSLVLHSAAADWLTLPLRHCRRSRTVIENAIQSCLQVATLSPENVAKARILRARARRANGLQMGAQEGESLLRCVSCMLVVDGLVDDAAIGGG
jgi:hypothetical protein